MYGSPCKLRDEVLGIRMSEFSAGVRLRRIIQVTALNAKSPRSEVRFIQDPILQARRFPAVPAVRKLDHLGDKSRLPRGERLLYECATGLSGC